MIFLLLHWYKYGTILFSADGQTRRMSEFAGTLKVLVAVRGIQPLKVLSLKFEVETFKRLKYLHVTIRAKTREVGKRQSLINTKMSARAFEWFLL